MKVFVSRDEEVREIENTKFNESKKKKKKNRKEKKVACVREIYGVRNTNSKI